MQRRSGRLSLERAGMYAAGYALTIPLCLWLLVQFPFTVDRLALYFIAPLVPFFLAGMALSTIFALRKDIAGSLYFADLIGASAGAVVVTLLLQLVGGEATLLVATVAAGVASALLSPRLRLPAGLLAAAVAGLAFTNGSTGLF